MRRVLVRVGTVFHWASGLSALACGADPSCELEKGTIDHQIIVAGVGGNFRIAVESFAARAEIWMH